MKKLSPAAIDEIADVLANLMIRAAKEQIEKKNKSTITNNERKAVK